MTAGAASREVEQLYRPVLVVQPAIERVVVPVVGRLPLRLRQCLLGFERIADDDQVGATPGQDAADRGGEMPCAVVSNSGVVACCIDRCVAAKMCRCQPLATMCRTLCAKQSSRYTALMSRRLMTSKLAIMETTIRIPDNLAGGGLETTARPPRGAT